MNKVMMPSCKILRGLQEAVLQNHMPGYGMWLNAKGAIWLFYNEDMRALMNHKVSQWDRQDERVSSHGYAFYRGWDE